MKILTSVLLTLILVATSIAQTNTLEECMPEPTFNTTNPQFPGKTIMEWNDPPCNPPTAWYVEGTSDPSAITNTSVIWEVIQPTLSRCAWSKIVTSNSVMWAKSCSKVVVFTTADYAFVRMWAYRVPAAELARAARGLEAPYAPTAAEVKLAEQVAKALGGQVTPIKTPKRR